MHKGCPAYMQTIYPYMPSKFQNRNSKTTLFCQDTCVKQVRKQCDKNVYHRRVPQRSKKLKYQAKSETQVGKPDNKLLLFDFSNRLISYKKKPFVGIRNETVAQYSYKIPLSSDTETLKSQRKITALKTSKSDRPTNLELLNIPKASTSFINSKTSKRKQRPNRYESDANLARRQKFSCFQFGDASGISKFLTKEDRHRNKEHRKGNKKTSKKSNTEYNKVDKGFQHNVTTKCLGTGINCACEIVRSDRPNRWCACAAKCGTADKKVTTDRPCFLLHRNKGYTGPAVCKDKDPKECEVKELDAKWMWKEPKLKPIPQEPKSILKKPKLKEPQRKPKPKEAKRKPKPKEAKRKPKPKETKRKPKPKEPKPKSKLKEKPISKPKQPKRKEPEKKCNCKQLKQECISKEFRKKYECKPVKHKCVSTSENVYPKRKIYSSGDAPSQKCQTVPEPICKAWAKELKVLLEPRIKGFLSINRDDIYRPTVSDESKKRAISKCELDKLKRCRKVCEEERIRKEEAICDAKRIQRHHRKRAEMRKRQSLNKRAKKINEKQVREYKKYSDCILVGESMLDIAKLGFSAAASVAECTAEAIMDPKCAYYNLRRAYRKPEQTISKIKYKISNSQLFPTAKRVKNRIVATETFQDAKFKVENNPTGYYILHLNDIKKRVKFKRRRPRRKRAQLDFHCDLFVQSLRTKRCLYVYNTCPWFYAQCISLLSIWTQFVNVILFILAVAVWTPCILVMEMCRAMLCCFFCTG